jgi:hypothetical protein
MREKEKLKKMKKEEDDKEGKEEEQCRENRDKSTLFFFFFFPLSSSCFSSIYSISINQFLLFGSCHLQERKRTFFFSLLWLPYGWGVVQVQSLAGLIPYL